MVKRSITLFVILFGLYFGLVAQPIQTRQYPQNFFRYPLDLPPSTAGSFAELRPNHFHSGLDFKTNQTTGYPVHTAADGYISRLRVQFGGFGNAVYITHPNGFTTVYGHLQRFSPAMEKLVRDNQYQQQSFEVDFKLPPMQMPVCKDDIIAWSGNTGASGGPHLHFEIRDTGTEQTINPQLFGLTIRDKVAPTIKAIGIYHLNGAPFSESTPRQFFSVVGSNGNYHLAKPGVINLSGYIGFGITADDVNSTSANHNGVYSIELKLDGVTVYTFAVERFAFDQTHAINAYIDYPEFLKAHRFIQKCFIPPGSRISLYPQSINKGIITFSDDAMHKVEYVVKDVAGNTSTLTLNVKSSPVKELAPIHKINGTLFPYDRVNQFSNDKVKVTIQPGNLYDDLDFVYKALPKKPGAYSATYSIGDIYAPVHENYDIWIKPDSTIGKYADKAVIVSAEGVCESNIYQDGYVKAKARGFGNFYIKLDTVPPHIFPQNIKNGARMAAMKKIYFRMEDNLSGIKSYNGKIDGKWILMELDYKTKLLSYTFTGDITAGKHIFELTVSDNKNNTSTYTAEFYR